MRFLYGNPGNLDDLAATLDARARQVLACGDDLRHAAARAVWTGAGADAFRGRLDERLGQFHAAADGLRAAGRAVRSHADTLRTEAALARAAERAVLGWLP